MKPPKTDALWTQLERLGWHRDAAPIAEIMASHEAMERELAELKQERLTLLSDDGRQSAEIIHLEAKLASERALADRLGSWMAEHRKAWQWHKVDPSCDCEDCEFIVPFDRALAAWKAARIDAHLDECIEKSAESWKPLPGDPEQFYTQEGNEHSH